MKIKTIISVSISFGPLVGVVFHRLFRERERCTRENQVSFRSGWVCIDHVFTEPKRSIKVGKSNFFVTDFPESAELPHESEQNLSN